MEDNIKVVCRIRYYDNNSNVCVNKKDTNTIELVSKISNVFTFDSIVGGDSSQEEMFQITGKPYVQACLEGYNGTIFCYGQTGSGKSYTIFGPDIEGITGDHRGIAPRIFEYLFSYMSHIDSMQSVSYKLSFFEVYNEKVYDLFDDTKENLDVKEDSRHYIYIKDLTQSSITTIDEAKRVLEMGLRNRKIGATVMNRYSSRSHAILQIEIQKTETSASNVQIMTTSKLTMVDLAGSEDQRDTHATGDRLKEAGKINTSLSTLSQVISGLSSTSRCHVPFRDSKLTYILRDSLGGNSKTILVATITPDERHMAQTLSTLKFAQRAKKIKTSPIINEEHCGSMLALQEEIKALRALLLQQQQAHQPSMQSNAYNGTNNILSSPFSKSMSGTPSKLLLPITIPIPINFSACNTPSKLRAYHGEMSGLNHLTSNGDSKLLVEALERTKASDFIRLKLEIKNEEYSRRLDAEENLNMSLKMKIKMKESEIRSLKKSSGGGSDSDVAIEEKLKVEIAAAKAELKSECLRYRKIIEDMKEKEKAQLALVAAAATTTTIADDEQTLWMKPEGWSDDREVKFQHDLLHRVLAAESVNVEQQRKIEAIGSERFETEFGFNLHEARSLRTRCEEAEGRALSTEIRLEALTLALFQGEQRIMDTEQKTANKLRDLEKELAVSRRKEDDLNYAAQVLRNEIQEKEEQLQELIAGKVSSEAEILALQHKKDMETRELINKLMKDNTVLLRSTRELEDSLAVSKYDNDKYEIELSKLKLDLHTLQLECEDNKQKLNDTIEASNVSLTESMKQYNDLQLLQNNILEENNTLKGTLIHHEEMNRKLEAMKVQNARELDKLRFQLENANDDLDNLLLQADSFSNIRMALENELATSNTKLVNVESQLLTLTEHNDTLLQEIANYCNDHNQNGQRMAETLQQLQEERNHSTEVQLQLEMIQSKLSAVTEETKRLKSELECNSNNHAILLTQTHELRITLKNKESDLEDIHAIANDRMTEISELRDKIYNLEEESERTISLMNSLEDEIGVRKDLLKEASLKCDQFIEVVRARDDTIATLQESIEEKTTTILAVTEKMASVAKERDDVQMKFDQIRDAIRSSENITSTSSPLLSSSSSLSLSLSLRDSLHHPTATFSALVNSDIMQDNSTAEGVVDGEEELVASPGLKELQAALQRQKRNRRSLDARLADRDRSIAQAKAEIQQLQSDLLIESEKGRQFESLACRMMEQLAGAQEKGQQSVKLSAILASRESELRELTHLYQAAKVHIAAAEQNASELSNELFELKGLAKEYEITRELSESMEQALSSALLDRDTYRENLQIKTRDMVQLQSDLDASREKIDCLEKKLVDVQYENIKLSGHTNSKQKIQVMMQLKNDLQEKEEALKNQYDEIVRLACQRDQYKRELEQIKASLKSEEMRAVATTRRSRRKPLVDIDTNCI